MSTKIDINLYDKVKKVDLMRFEIRIQPLMYNTLVREAKKAGLRSPAAYVEILIIKHLNRKYVSGKRG